MPLSSIAQAALAQGGSQAASGLINGIFGWIGQRKQRKHERAMYERQLADNRKNWELENIYNSPVQQMQRLKQAGLNPNLVYGNGATALGGSVDSANPTVTDQSKAFMPFGSIADAPMTAINALYDLRMKDAQANLLELKGKTEVQNEALRQFQALNETIQNEKGRVDLNWYRDNARQLMKQIQITTQHMLADVQNTRMDTRLKSVSADLGGSRKQYQDILSQQEQMSLDMYKSLGLPPQIIDQILKTAPFLAPILNRLRGKGK